MSETEEFRVIIAVGRDKTEHAFESRIAPYLYDNFKIRGIYALGNPTDMDDSERFICFVAGDEVGHWTAESQIVRLSRRSDTRDGTPITCKVFDDMEDALKFANKEYAFVVSEQIQAFRNKSMEVFERFGFSTAKETEDFAVFMSLANSGMLALTRGILDDEQVPVVVLLSSGSDGTIVRPLAFLITDEMKEGLELPMELSDNG